MNALSHSDITATHLYTNDTSPSSGGRTENSK